MVNWRYGKETKFSYPFSQAIGYKHCVQNNKSDWWTTIDPDEYIMLHKHDDIKSFIKSNSQKPRLLLEQKIFDKRVVGKSVREIFNWGYQDGYTKTLVRKPYFFTHEGDYEKNFSLNKASIYFDVHETYSEIGTCTNNFNSKRLLALGYRYSENKAFLYNKNSYKEIIWNIDRFVIDKNEAELFHYRGTSADIGFSFMSKHSENQWSEFDKIDKSMEKYL